MNPQENYRLRPKVVLLGAQGVGKTSLLNCQNGQHFSCEISPTIGAGYSLSSVQTEQGMCDLQVWDTAGQERFRSMAPLYYRNADGALVVYDVTSDTSLHAAKRWVNELQQFVGSHVCVCIVGNKTDLLSTEHECLDDGRLYAQSINAPHCLTSALNATGVFEAFKALAEQIQRTQQSVSDTTDQNLQLSEETSNQSNDKKMKGWKSKCYSC